MPGRYLPCCVLVVAGRIAGDGERAFDEDEHRQLAGARALHLRVGLSDLELRRLPVGEPARRVVGPAGQHAREGKRGLVFGRFLVAPLVVFIALDALARDLVGPGAVQAGRFERAVEVDQQMVLGRRLGDVFVPFDGPLVVAVNEVDLQPRNAPFRNTWESPACKRRCQ